MPKNLKNKKHSSSNISGSIRGGRPGGFGGAEGFSGGGFEGGDFSEFFESMFGGAAAAAGKGQPGFEGRILMPNYILILPMFTEPINKPLPLTEKT